MKPTKASLKTANEVLAAAQAGMKIEYWSRGHLVELVYDEPSQLFNFRSYSEHSHDFFSQSFSESLETLTLYSTMTEVTIKEPAMKNFSIIVSFLSGEQFTNCSIQALSLSQAKAQGEDQVRLALRHTNRLPGDPIFLNVWEEGKDCPDFSMGRYGTIEDAPLGL